MAGRTGLYTARYVYLQRFVPVAYACFTCALYSRLLQAAAVYAASNYASDEGCCLFPIQIDAICSRNLSVRSGTLIASFSTIESVPNRDLLIYY